MFLLASKPTVAEAAEVDLLPDGRSPGILPYREKSAAAGNLKLQFANAISCTPSSTCGGNFEETNQISPYRM